MENSDLKRYKFIKIIGQGSFSTVWHGIHIATGTDVAIKLINKKDMTESDLRSSNEEISFLRDSFHPYIVGFYDLIETEEFTYIILEYLHDNSLMNYLSFSRSLTEKEASRIFYQLLSAVEYLHSVKQIAHRDLKLENVMLTKDINVKLIDFNLSQDCSKPMDKKCGSHGYIAPEIIKNKKYDESSDIWSLGIILFALVHGSLPFNGETDNKKVQQILYKQPEISKNLSSNLTDLITKILTKDPTKRITIEQIKAHPWFTTEQERVIMEFDGVDKQIKDLLSKFTFSNECNEDNEQFDEKVTKQRIDLIANSNKIVKNALLMNSNSSIPISKTQLKKSPPMFMPNRAPKTQKISVNMNKLNPIIRINRNMMITNSK